MMAPPVAEQPAAPVLGERVVACQHPGDQYDLRDRDHQWLAEIPEIREAPPRLLTKPVHENSNQSGDMTTAASRFLAYGDFQQFVIVDRVGSTLEILPGYGARLHQLSRLGARQRSWATANDLGQVRELLIKLRSPTGEHKGGSVLKPVGLATGGRR